MIQIYIKALPSMWIETRYGKITYWDFLCKEKENMELHGRKVELKGGEVKENSRHCECYLLANKIV